MHDNIHQALLASKDEFKPLKKTGKNPHFKNEYSTLDDIREATGDALKKHGITIIHSSVVTTDFSYLTTCLYHVSSNTHVEAHFFLENESPQKMGSAMTYGRRYNLVNLLDLIADVDDDGESYYDRSSKSSGGTTKTRKGLGGRLS